MSMCAGKTDCEIYRDKRFCRRSEVRQDEYRVCRCSHARMPCQIGSCSLTDICEQYSIMKEAEHGKV